MKSTKILLILAAVASLGFLPTSVLAQGKPKPTLDTPTVRCADTSGASFIDLSVCAGASGAPAGFSVQWMTLEAYNANGGTFDGASGIEGSGYCNASFSGNANLSRYNLAAGECTSVRIGELLMDNGASTACPEGLLNCTTYVFRVFAHATSTLKRSAFSSDITCSTTCPEDCDPAVLSQGFWKNHPEVWTGVSLTLGTVSYSDAQLVSILSEPVKGNGLIALAHQLIATKLNIQNGASVAYIADTAGAVAAADALIGGLVVPPVGTGYLAPSSTSGLTLALDTAIGNYHCQ